MTLGLKFLSLKKEIYDFKKNPFRYVFSIAITYSCEAAWVKVLVSKGWLQSEITAKTLKTKKNRGGEVGRVKDIEFSGVK